MFIQSLTRKVPPHLSHMPTPMDCSGLRERKFYQLPFFIIQTDRKTQLSLRIQTRNEKQLLKLLLILHFFSEDAQSQRLDFWEGSQQDPIVNKTRGRLDCGGGHSGQKTSLWGKIEEDILFQSCCFKKMFFFLTWVPSVLSLSIVYHAKLWVSHPRVTLRRWEKGGRSCDLTLPWVGGPVPIPGSSVGAPW